MKHRIDFIPTNFTIESPQRIVVSKETSFTRFPALKSAGGPIKSRISRWKCIRGANVFSGGRVHVRFVQGRLRIAVRAIWEWIVGDITRENCRRNRREAFLKIIAASRGTRAV